MKARAIARPQKDPKKESLLKELTAAFERSGFTVRREKLKAGPGWKVISGSCRLNEQKLVFVDPRLPQEDQILFLRARAEAFGISLEGVDFSASPEEPVRSAA